MKALFKTVAAAIVLAAVLPGCKAQEAVQPGKTADTPSFTGPWASVLAHEHEVTKSVFARQALEDGKISEAERAAAIERFRNCLTQNGLSSTVYRDNGSFQIDINDRVAEDDPSQEKMPICRETSGLDTIDSIFQEMRSNPQNRDPSEIMVECLLRAKAVPEGYTVADFDREYPLDKVTLLRPELKNTEANPVVLCENDPLGLTPGIG